MLNFIWNSSTITDWVARNSLLMPSSAPAYCMRIVSALIKRKQNLIDACQYDQYPTQNIVRKQTEESTFWSKGKLL